MTRPRLSRLELRIMDALWQIGAGSVREIQERLPPAGRPAYTTVQTVLYRLEAKHAIRRSKKVGNAHVFEPVVSRQSAQRQLVDELLAFFGGRTEPVIAHLIESGKLTRADLRDAEKALRRLSKIEKSSGSGEAESE